ncbi:MAG: M48 family metalloprotease, partial [Ketobacter sp.]|nr:M48 family metalloprotease [Ketobacter sp.]
MIEAMLIHPKRFFRKWPAWRNAAWLLCFLCIIIAPFPSHARSLIRDAETEYVLRLYTNPILEAAGIAPEAVRLFIINDPSINAFVAGGQNIFIHTGLILKSEKPDMLIGVLAHETGHIAGAHLTRLTQKLDDVSLGAILSTILGTAATIGGSGDLGSAILTGGQNIAQLELLAHIRSNEQAADQAALSYLDANGISASGMIAMFELLQRNERQKIRNP